MSVLKIEPEGLAAIFRALTKGQHAARLDPSAGIDIEMQSIRLGILEHQLGSMGNGKFLTVKLMGRKRFVAGKTICECSAFEINVQSDVGLIGGREDLGFLQ